jgi:hypothetical protein
VRVITLPSVVVRQKKFVRGEKHEIPAAVPVGGDDIEFMFCHVFVVTREDDQTISLCQAISSRRDGVEVRIREVIHFALRLDQPAHERLLVMLVVRNDAAVLERPPEPCLPGARVPGVEGAVAVVVVEAVRLPCHRGEDAGHGSLAEVPWAQDERCIPDLVVGSSQLREIEAAGPITYANA